MILPPKPFCYNAYPTSIDCIRNGPQVHMTLINLEWWKWGSKANWVREFYKADLSSFVMRKLLVTSGWWTSTKQLFQEIILKTKWYNDIRILWSLSLLPSFTQDPIYTVDLLMCCCLKHHPTGCDLKQKERKKEKTQGCDGGLFVYLNA